MPQGLDLGVLGEWGVVVGQKFYFSEIQPIWCVSYSHEWHFNRHNLGGGGFPPPGALGKGKKGKISFNFIYKVNFKDL